VCTNVHNVARTCFSQPRVPKCYFRHKNAHFTRYSALLTVGTSTMYTEIFDAGKRKVPCAYQIQCHAVLPVRVGLTFGHRLQQTYICVDCGTTCIKLVRHTLNYAKNTESGFDDFICVKYDDTSTVATGYV